MKVVLCGDWHGNRQWAAICIKFAADHGIEQLIQLGDNGFVWRQDNNDKISQVAGAFGVKVAFLPGNHENWALLDGYEEQRDLRPVGPLGGILTHPNVEYLGRVSTFELGGARFICVGGAFSIDKDHRVPGRSWWEEELTREDAVDEVGRIVAEYGPADIFLSHDAPANRTIQRELDSSNWHLSLKLEGASLANRERVGLAFKASRATRAIHGHFHHLYVHSDADCYIVGLNCDDYPDSIAVLDTETYRVEVNQEWPE